MQAESSKHIASSREETMRMARESRDEVQGKHEHSSDERDESDGRKTSSPSHSKSGSGAGSKKSGRFGFSQGNGMGSSRGTYPPMVRGPGGAPFGPPPYGYMGSSYGPPPPHYHPGAHMHMGPYGGGPFPGHVGAGMKGPNFPPHPHYHGAPYGMPPAYPHQQSMNVPSTFQMGSSSDSVSISSKGSMNSKKKRTIDGVHGHLPSAYSFRRTDSNSEASTLTTANNTSMETTLTSDSHHKADHSDSLSLNIDGMVFEDKPQHTRGVHRRGCSTHRAGG